MNKSGGGGGGALPGELGTVVATKDRETYPKQCAQNIKKQVPFPLCSQFVFHCVLRLTTD